jgi:type I restriction enzyme M protein
MITGPIKSQIDQIWNAFWSGGISNPIEVIEQITYLLFLRRLDDLHTLEENKAARLKEPIVRRVFPQGKDGIGKGGGRSYEDLRWSRFKHFAPAEMYSVVGEHVFPFLRTLGGDDSTYAHHMKDARFTIPTAGLLAKVVDLLDNVPMEDRDTKGDLYEYMLGKIATAGQNGQFRTPRHIIRLMVELTAPQPTDIICDPACGTAGFLVAAGEYLREHHPNILHDRKLREHFHHGMFHGYDFDNTMLRIGSMNMLLHGVENPDIRYRDSLAQDHAADEEAYTLVLANPPFAGSLDYENTAKDLLQIVKTKKTELLFLALFLKLLKPGGRAAVIVPDGVLFGSSKAHKELRRMLVEEQKLDGVIKLPGGVFKPSRVCQPRSWCSPRPTPAGPTTCGSTTWRPTAGASTTSARRCCRRTSLVRCLELRSLLRSRRRTTCPTSARAGRSATAPSASARGWRRASACRSPTSPRRDTTCR